MLRYAHDSELYRLRRSNMKTRLICGLLIPIEITGFAYVLSQLLSL
jgi:hypothetical protein